MRVLFVYKEKNGDNLFVPVIRTRLSVHGIEAISSVDEFWNPSRSYDIIHIHWPEEVVGWNVNDVDVNNGTVVASGVTEDNYSCIKYEPAENADYVLRRAGNTAVLHKALSLTLRSISPDANQPINDASS